MTQILKPGESVETEGSALVCRVEAFLGGGGQGEVYRATLGGQSVALKWYFPNTATPEQRASLETLVKSGAPNDKFLWPLDLARASNKPGFGYVMLLRDNRYKGLVDLMKRRIDPSFRALTTAGIGLAHSFLQLHSKGLCYRDISFGNVFFDPDTGDVLICDNDNVAVDGTASSGVLGTPRFMAPEVVRGQAMPSTQTDLFSLAVLLFYMLMTHHPLEGKKEYDIHSFDAPAMNKLYGEEPVFVFDPIDDSNRPVPNYHDNVLKSWLIYPRFLQNLFTRAFTDGIRDPNSRTRESEWRAALVQLRDAIVYCPRCSAENFYDGDVLREAGKLAPCWACGAEMQLPARMRIGKKVIMLNRDTYLYPHHIDEQRLYDFSAPIAAMTQHPRDPNVWGIKNLSSDNWVSTTATGSVNDVPSGRSGSSPKSAVKGMSPGRRRD